MALAVQTDEAKQPGGQARSRRAEHAGSAGGPPLAAADAAPQIGLERDDAEWLHNSAVKAQMKRMDPSFSEKSLRVQVVQRLPALPCRRGRNWTRFDGRMVQLR